jgi:hypothetical protein
MSATVVRQVTASPISPALVLRPWHREDVAALVEMSRDSAAPVGELCRGQRCRRDTLGAGSASRAAGDRFGFTVLEAQPGSVGEQLLGDVVLKEVTSGIPTAEVGY